MIAASQEHGFSAISKQTLAGMENGDREELFGRLKSSLDLAVHVSPLVLLASVPGKRFQMDRAVLIKVCPPFSLFSRFNSSHIMSVGAGARPKT